MQDVCACTYMQMSSVVRGNTPEHGQDLAKARVQVHSHVRVLKAPASKV
jgi:hypothetical protein